MIGVGKFDKCFCGKDHRERDKYDAGQICSFQEPQKSSA